MLNGLFDMMNAHVEARMVKGTTAEIRIEGTAPAVEAVLMELLEQVAGVKKLSLVDYLKRLQEAAQFKEDVMKDPSKATDMLLKAILEDDKRGIK